MDKYRSILVEGENACQFAKDNYDTFKKKADEADVVTYGTKADGLGLFCPSLIWNMVDKNCSKGKVIKKIPDGLQRYNIYESTIEGKPLRMRKINQFGCDLSFYFFEKDNNIYAVPFLKETNKKYPTDMHSIKYKNGKVLSYVKATDIHFFSEEYDYSQTDKGIIMCERCYYVGPSVEDRTQEQIDSENRLAEDLRKRVNREIFTSDTVHERITKWHYKLYYEVDKLSYIEEFYNNQGELIFNRMIKVRK